MPKEINGSGVNKYNNYPQCRIELPFRMLVVGSSGSMKTNSVLNIIAKMGAFTKIYLFAKNTKEPLYEYLVTTLSEVGRKLKTDVIFASESLEDLPQFDDIDKKENNLIIFDDMVTESSSALKLISEYYIRGRKHNISCIFISQSYYGTPKIIRQNCDYIVIKKINTKKDLKRLLDEYNLGDNVDSIMGLYTSIVSKDKTNFLLIDLNTNEDGLKYRCNFDPVLDLTTS